jgi:hypothetical protein
MTMKLLNIFLQLLLSLCISTVGFGQNKVVLEQIQTYSTINPKATYWHLPANNTSILNALDTGLFAQLDLQRELTILPQYKTLNKQSQIGKLVVDWSNSRAYPYHAYLELYELDPEFVYDNKLAPIPELKKDSIHSIWYIACNIYNQKQEKLFGKTLLIGIIPIHSLGMGYETNTTGSVPSNVFEGIAKAISLLSPNMDNMEYLEAKMPKAYATDNYWMPFIHNQPRILFDTAKKFISYSSNNNIQILKISEAGINKINIKDKSIDNPFKEVIEQLRKSKYFYNNNEYYQVIQPLRNVHEDIDYTLEAYIELNSEYVNNNDKIFGIKFLPDSLHHIYQQNERIGAFMVKENNVEQDKFYYPDKVYNGYDSSRTFSLGTFIAKQPITNAKSIEGNLLGHEFSIKINYDTNLKTISLDGSILMIVEGNKKPTQMVLTDKKIPSTLTNLLLLIAFSEIFQRPA